VIALSLVSTWAAPGAASDHPRFFGRAWPPAGSAAFRAEAARSGAVGPQLLRDRRNGRQGAIIAWTGDGVPLTGPFFPEVSPTLTMDAGGGAIAAWVDFRNASTDIFAQRITSNGEVAPGWPANGRAMSLSDSNEFQPWAVPDGTGGAFVAFGVVSGPMFSDVLAQRVTASGTIAPGWPANGLSLVPGDAEGFAAFRSSSGSFILGWLDPASGIRGLRVLDTGALAPGWPAGGLSLGPPISLIGEVNAAPDNVGGLYVVWIQTDSIMITRLAANGTFPSGWSAAGLVLSTGPAFVDRLSVVTLSGGDALASWSDFRSGSNVDIYAMRATASGGLGAGWPANGAPVATAAGDQDESIAVADAVDGAIVTWRDANGATYAKRLTASGGLSAGWPAGGLALCGAVPGKFVGDPISDNASGVIIAWSGTGVAGNNIFAQRAASNGAIAPGWPAGGAIVCDFAGSKYSPAVTSNGAGGIITVWEDYRDFYPRLYAGQVLVDGTVPALAALVEAVAEPDRVRLLWHSPDGAAFAATLERAEEGGGFVTLAVVRADGAGLVSYEDRDVIAGRTYRYRLAVSEAGATRYLGDVTLRVPDRARLAIEGFRPNPAAGEPTLAFALSGRDPARIEIFDLAGRRVLEREIAGGEPGERVLPLSDARLRGGLYLLRLTQGARSVTATGVVVR